MADEQAEIDVAKHIGLVFAALLDLEIKRRLELFEGEVEDA